MAPATEKTKTGPPRRPGSPSSAPLAAGSATRFGALARCALAHHPEQSHVSQPDKARCRHLNEHAVDQFKALFLPVGFPDTVKDNYVRYSAMAALTNLLISTNMTLSSALLLYAVGLGSAAVPMAGALNWVIKEGVGQAGALRSPSPCSSGDHASSSSHMRGTNRAAEAVCMRVVSAEVRACRHAAARAHGGARL